MLNIIKIQFKNGNKREENKQLETIINRNTKINIFNKKKMVLKKKKMKRR